MNPPDRFAEIRKTVNEGLGCLLPEQDIRWLVTELNRLTEHRDARRARISRTALRLPLNPAFRAEFPGNTTVIPVLPDDPVSYLIDRFTEAEDAAVLAISDGDTCRLIRLTEVTIPAEGGEQ